MSLHFFCASGSHKDQESPPTNIFPDDLDDDTVVKARRSTACETGMKKRIAVKTWFPGVCFAMSLSLACIMEGYGLVLIAGFFASPAFKTHFGCPESLDGMFDCEIPARWQTALIDGALGSQMIGIVLNGWFTERYGYRKTFLGALSALTLTITMTFFAPNLEILLGGFILCGIPWGIFQTLTTSYASDVCPTPIRAYFTMWTNLCWVLGQLMGAVVQRVLVNNRTELNYKIPLGLQWVFPLPIFIAALLAPESPWWLVRQGRTYDAYKAMGKLTNMKHAPPEYNILNHIASMYVTNKTERDSKLNGCANMGYIDCFKGINMRRTTNCCLIWGMQNACGAALMQFSAYFFLQAGLGPEFAFTFTLIQYAIGIVGTVISWGLVTRIGRRTLYLNGMLLLFTCLIIIGIISVSPLQRKPAGLTVGSLLLVFTLFYNCTVGPITYSLVSELPSTRLKSKTINLARACYLIVGLINGIITPLMLNPQSANWGAKTAWFWAGFAALCATYTYFCVPEPKDLTYGQIDELYSEKISAQNFEAAGQRLRERSLVQHRGLGHTDAEENMAEPKSGHDSNTITDIQSVKRS